MGQTFISDSADVFLKRKRDNHVVVTGTTQVAGMSASEDSDTIRGGIGDKALYTIKSGKEVELNVTDAVFDMEYLAMTQGAEIKDGEAKVTKNEKGLEVTKGSGSGSNLQVKLSGKPDGKVTLIDDKGNNKEVDASSETVELKNDFASEGDKVTAVYKENVTGRVTTLSADKFSENYEVSYHTIEYDVDTNEVTRDIYFEFPNVNPSGEFEMSFENGEALTPELTFNALGDKDTGKIADIVEVDRNEKSGGKSKG